MKTLKEARHDIAEVHMTNASRVRISEHTRGICAFDAGYTWLLVALDEPRGGEHPSSALLRAASRRLHVDDRIIAPGLVFLSQRLEPFGEKQRLQAMLEWAKKMKALATSI